MNPRKEKCIELKQMLRNGNEMAKIAGKPYHPGTHMGHILIDQLRRQCEKDGYSCLVCEANNEVKN